ncbi:hypothetical protein M407DRAFT_91537 [Tulasnella calospora MUT 4182]|uniref:Uncharacterized protein n=1 Tax=Tulasnella calospora MUT 4182 TaxID=1051891 RepID=A0A0C3LVQ7_9AGAM|nr:hypothetical protein M407DRAFT_91537 [Tulasnella calospora MUT 4182]
MTASSTPQHPSPHTLNPSSHRQARDRVLKLPLNRKSQKGVSISGNFTIVNLASNGKSRASISGNFTIVKLPEPRDPSFPAQSPQEKTAAKRAESGREMGLGSKVAVHARRVI